MAEKRSPRPHRRTFKVTLTIPEGATITDAKAYILDAVSSWHGSLRPPGAYGELEDPGDPMHGLDGDSVDVTLARVKRRRPFVGNMPLLALPTEEEVEFHKRAGTIVDK